VVVNYNGGARTLQAIESLRGLDWPPAQLDIVLVDNASSDGVAARVQNTRDDVRVIEAGVNLGFGGGCNLGMGDLVGVELVALLNPDAEVEPDWLWRLARAHEADPALAGACPKVLFDVPFREMELSCPTSTFGRGDRRALGVLVSGARVAGEEVGHRLQFVQGFWGPEPDDRPGASSQWSAGTALLRVPVGAGPAAGCELLLSSATGHKEIRLRSGDEQTVLHVDLQPRWHPVALGGKPVEVINSLGITVGHDGYAADRGWLQQDQGQWDEPVEVQAWSGAAVLLRAEHLRQVGGFDDTLFLYYEDVELSLRARRAGWRHVAVPQAVARHVHSATVVTGSPLHQYFSERNRLIVLASSAPPAAVLAVLTRFVVVTASYARRDVIAPLLRGARPRWQVTRLRLAALAGFARALPRVRRRRAGRPRPEIVARRAQGGAE
jgi:GT2 family glycosyltransferase